MASFCLNQGHRREIRHWILTKGTISQYPSLFFDTTNPSTRHNFAAHRFDQGSELLFGVVDLENLEITSEVALRKHLAPR